MRPELFNRLQLETGYLHGNNSGLHVVHQTAEGHPDIAAGSSGTAGLLHNIMEEGGGGRLTVGSGNRIHFNLICFQPVGQFQFAYNRNSQSISFLQRGNIQRHTRTNHYQVQVQGRKGRIFAGVNYHSHVLQLLCFGLNFIS
ncbi:hypothetical protein SDC9_184346 [bioreactor metagenome]|uniref:Uncharacterized protein n=1 Tax=bioreactor metagenome TaxID=1076179 RepID=A0A645HL15_9ZZZZ